MKTAAVTALGVSLALCGLPAQAHSTRSVSIDLIEISPGRAMVHIRSANASDDVRLHFDPPCVSTPAAGSPADGTPEALQVECPGSIAGQTLSVTGLGPFVTEAILIASFQNGARVSRVLTSENPTLQLPEQQSGLALGKAYVRLGVVHIFTGYDHLLFLLALVLLLKRVRSVLWAESAFTVSHSVSFAATALGWIRVSPTAAEACIALSLVLLALDLGRGAIPSVRKGAGTAFVFGLVHGLGFAGGLREVGLPDHEVSVALLGFATGIEIGQVTFLAGVLIAVSWIERRPQLRWVESGLATLIGGISSYWLIDRLLLCFSVPPSTG